MVRHVIIWTLKDTLSLEERAEVKQNAKRKLEALVGRIDGLVSLKVQTEYLPSSNAELMLDSVFVDEAALKHYATHPEHVAIAKNDVVPYVASRACMDFEI